MTVDLSSYKVNTAELSSATKFDNLVQAVQDALNSLPPSQITGFPSDSTKFLRGDAAWAVPPAPASPTKLATAVDVVNTTTETSILGSGQTIAANTMGTDKMLRVTLLCDYLNNSGATKTFTFKIKFGGSDIYNDATLAINASASRYPVVIKFELVNQSATNVQFMAGMWGLGAAGGATTGIGDLGLSASSYVLTPIATNGSLAVDTTASQTLDVSITHSAAASTISFRRQYAMIEVVG